MGGSKNKSPAQKEKSEKKDADRKKSKKTEKGNDSKVKSSVIIDGTKALKYINDVNVITAYNLATQTNVKISEANSYLKKLLNDGTIEKVGGFSGHHLYKSVSRK